MGDQGALASPSEVEEGSWRTWGGRNSSWEELLPHVGQETSVLLTSQGRSSGRNLPLICRPWRLWQRTTLCFAGTRKSWRRSMFFLAVLVCLLVVYSLMESPHRSFMSLVRGRPPESVFQCGNHGNSSLHQHHQPPRSSENRLREDPKVLLFTETQYSRLGKAITEILVANRIKYKMEVFGKSLPVLTNLSKGKYGTVVFENFERYLQIDQWNRELLDKYLRDYNVGIVGFMPTHEETQVGAKLRGFPLFIHTNMALENASLNSDNPVLRLTRAGGNVSGNLPGTDWTVFVSDDPNYVPLEWACSSVPHYAQEKLVAAVLDKGAIDGIQRVVFGGGLEFWLHRLLFLDAISYLSMGRLSVSLDRYMLVDIDDIFVARKGIRMTAEDVTALLESQKRLQEMVPGWKFNLGFSGKYYQHGYPEENMGDRKLLEHVDDFWWFGHMWGHTQPHKLTPAGLEAQMQRNKQFAIDHGIPTDSGYSVAPHHSGVYPVHEPLYDAWKKVWNVRVTSSEEYPHLYPARLRRGFIHRNIMVLPRQTCGLFTHTIFINKYPGGRAVLDRSIHGGELFQSIVFNPISIFMTHLSNYGNDRLALYTFESVIKFIKCWTNLNLQTVPPLQLGEKYFHLYPEEKDPIWGDPCSDRRHMEIWSKNKTCEQLPKFLVIGPQKTGTTALYTFLTMHPAIVANYPSPETFEEIQFFNGKNYYKGIDWYMQFFPIPKNSSGKYLFEKSATYFEGEMVPKRVKSLLPNAKLVAIIIPPGRRAYSWYHHMRAHNDPTALQYSFYQVITATDSSPRQLRDLRNKCLNPGMYAKHIERWLDYFPASQLIIIDGEELRNDPVYIMNDLQKFLEIEPFYNYTEHLRYDKRKGFYCQVIEEDKTKCLGRGKGRIYPPMNESESKILKDFYQSYNVALEKLVTRLDYPVPGWLEDDLQ
ncbi:bifunctional heparan sulfate N-deacetylase/N-sulfotransferase-like isoform X2 [Penaeus japonicus]|uniref:bifunctional heparan sulfate N-deacetylase/N-sulfotransferase-like isoform X2 n=1 Tax=Penaeus japonicus TaxID=27405 RepID=UPI001C70B65A|nr:bifunctional heparan sulfate N-deacetylase/N-sulfotransferase-like isoform X2 [Penaeus japonicus]